MTPEERARHFIIGVGAEDIDGAIRSLAHEFRVAIAEEREACAKLGRAWAMQVDNVVAAIKAMRAGADGGDLHDALKFAADGIAADIVART